MPAVALPVVTRFLRPSACAREGGVVGKRILLSLLAFVILAPIALILWHYLSKENDQPLVSEALIGSWKSRDSKQSDLRITFWRSGDFQMSKTFKAGFVETNGSWA